MVRAILLVWLFSKKYIKERVLHKSMRGFGILLQKLMCFYWGNVYLNVTISEVASAQIYSSHFILLF